MFEQIVRRLHILEKMPGHEGGMIIRRIGNSQQSLSKPDYYIFFGNLAFRGTDAILRTGKITNGTSHLANALDQAFNCFYAQGIFALYLQLPGQSIEKIDQLRLSLNILARFRSAVEDNASITFRYFGRAMTVPLISDCNGRPDPNLTVVAGINALSAVNMRELIKQARAFCELALIPGEGPSQSYGNGNTFNQIYRIRSFRSQLIQPLVEINNLPWMQDDQSRIANGSTTAPTEPGKPGQNAKTPERTCPPGSAVLSQALHPSAFDFSYGYLRIYLDASERMAQDAAERLFEISATGMDAPALAKYIRLSSMLLYALQKATSDPLPFERLLSYLHERLEQVSEKVLISLTIQRQAIKAQIQNRTTMVGMVHPRLLDLIALVKERMAVQQKIAAVRALDFKAGDLTVLADRFEITGDAADKVFRSLETCFDDRGSFNRSRFAACIDTFARFANGVFEMVWCILRHAPNADDRFSFLNALPLLADRLPDPKRALAFLLCDLFQSPLRVEASDRNAFGLASQMLRTHNQEGHIDLRSTPEDVLAVRNSLNTEIVRYAAWRMDIDALRVLTKFDAIQDALRRCVLNSTPAPLRPGRIPGFQFLLTLEREGLIFISLAGGKTARMVLRKAFAFYADPQSEIYQDPRFSTYLSDIVAHLRIVLRGMGRLGEPQDLDQLKLLEQSAPQLMALDADPAFARRVKQTLQWVAPVIRVIQARLNQDEPA
ncbi:MAG: hypothetical protein C4519_20160 [Desulfobacteraceae bacterium]|nr:MAG: hypothetical protein C4519_20160 [Desulfobacteraceae bacterium]